MNTGNNNLFKVLTFPYLHSCSWYWNVWSTVGFLPQSCPFYLCQKLWIPNALKQWTAWRTDLCFPLAPSFVLLMLPRAIHKCLGGLEGSGAQAELKGATGLWTEVSGETRCLQGPSVLFPCHKHPQSSPQLPSLPKRLLKSVWFLSSIFHIAHPLQLYA